MSGSSRFRLVAVQLGRRLIEGRRRPVVAGGERSLRCLLVGRPGLPCCCRCRRLPLREDVERAMGGCPRASSGCGDARPLAFAKQSTVKRACADEIRLRGESCGRRTRGVELRDVRGRRTLAAVLVVTTSRSQGFEFWRSWWRVPTRLY